MTALYIIAFILLFLLLFALMRIGVSGEYSEEGLLIKAKIGPIMVKVFPTEEKKKEKPKEKKKAAPKEEKEKRGGALKKVKGVFPQIMKALKRLKRKLRIDKLIIHYTVATTDPFKTAMQFGVISAGGEIISALLENNFNIKEQDIATAFTFEEIEPEVYINAKITLAVWEIIYIAFGFLIFFLRQKSASNNRKVG